MSETIPYDGIGCIPRRDLLPAKVRKHAIIEREEKKSMPIQANDNKFAHKGKMDIADEMNSTH